MKPPFRVNLRKFEAIACLGLMLVCFSHAQPGKTPPETLRFAGKMYYLAFTSADERGIQNEYILQSETRENWTHLLSTVIFYGIDDPRVMASRVEEEIKSDYPDASVGMQVLPQNNQALLRFLIPRSEGRESSEFNFWRYQAMEAPRPQIMGIRFAYRQSGSIAEAINQNMETWTHEIRSISPPPPSYVVDRSLLNLLETKALDLIRRGETNSGVEQYMEIVAQDPQNPRRHLNFGSILFSYARTLQNNNQTTAANQIFLRSQESLIRSIRLFELFEKESIMHAQACFLLAEIIRNVNGNPDGAKLLYERAVEIDPNHQGARLALEL